MTELGFGLPRWSSPEGCASSLARRRPALGARLSLFVSRLPVDRLATQHCMLMNPAARFAAPAPSEAPRAGTRIAPLDPRLPPRSAVPCCGGRGPSGAA